MAQPKVTRKELRELHVGQTRIITLTDPKKIASARITCLQLKQEEGLEFTFKPDFGAVAVSITRTK